MNLLQDAEVLIRQELAQLGINHAKAVNLEQVLHLLLNLRFKRVSARPRKVNSTPLFDQKLTQLDSAMQQAVSTIITKVEQGHDLTGHLNKSTLDAEKTDGLLADWGIYHLHISDQKKNPTDTHYVRTGPVMFVFFRADAAYLVDIYSHGKDPVTGKIYREAWTRKELLSQIQATWPELLEPYLIKGVEGLSRPVSDLERATLRGAGINTMIDLPEGVFFGPGGGISTAKTSIAITRTADQIMSHLRSLEKDLQHLDSSKIKCLAELAQVPPDDLDFELTHPSPDEWIVVVRNTQVPFITIRNLLPD